MTTQLETYIPLKDAARKLGHTWVAHGENDGRVNAQTWQWHHRGRPWQRSYRYPRPFGWAPSAVSYDVIADNRPEG